MKNLFSDLPSSLPQEWVDILASGPNVRIERIVSTGHRSPSDGWYDQDENEWVTVLRGEAELLFEGDVDAVPMHPGDHLLIPSHRRHRVQRTSEDQPTVWLAVFFPDDVP